MEAIEELLEYYSGLKEDYRQEELVELLREIQTIFGEINQEIQEQIADRFHIGLPIIKNIIKLYPSLHETKARHRIIVCTGRQCACKNSMELLKKVEQQLKIKKGQTTKDNRFTINTRSCLKHCKTAPNIMVDEDVYTAVTAAGIPEILKKYK